MTSTSHAERRWSERVGYGSLPEFLAAGRVSGRSPRWAWSRGGEGIGSRYVTCPDVPGVCVITRNAIAITVITRESTKPRRAFAAESIHVGRRKAMSA